MENKWMIVGLGNPGKEYALTRHNIGFMAIEYFLRFVGNSSEKNQGNAIFNQMEMDGATIYCVRPQTFMNLSGKSVQALLNFYKVPLENLIVVHDDIDQPFAQMRIHKNRGHGGHNGIRSITEMMGTMDYARLKLGVGRPDNPNIPVADYVLNRFNPSEMSELPDFLNKSCDALESMIKEGVQKASSKFNN